MDRPIGYDVESARPLSFVEMGLLSEIVAPELLRPPVNVLRATLHPRGLAPRIVNLAEYGSHVLSRLHRQVMVTGDPSQRALLAELAIESFFPADETTAAALRARSG